MKREDSGQDFVWQQCALNLGRSPGIGQDGIPAGSSELVVDCADRSVTLSYIDFIPGKRRRAIVDWDWHEETKMEDLMSCFTTMRADFPRAATRDDEVFIFGIMTFDERLGLISRRVGELASIGKNLGIKWKILLIYDGDRADEFVRAACMPSNVDCSEGSDFVNIVEIN